MLEEVRVQYRDTCRRVTNPGDRQRLVSVLLLLTRLLCAAALLPASTAHAGVLFTNLHSFYPTTTGASPSAGLVQGSDGNFYGTATSGGANNSGTVFMLRTNAALNTLTAVVTLYSFTGGSDGAGPHSRLESGADGRFYGTTAFGGVSNAGAVFIITTNGEFFGSTSFTNGNGAVPFAGLAPVPSTFDYFYFYGTTSLGGAHGVGTVFELRSDGFLTNLYSFTLGSDGRGPFGELVYATDKYLYGTTPTGGSNNAGTIFKISTNGVLTSRYSFTGGGDGANPVAGLVQGIDGSLYGTTTAGGANNAGTVFRIATNGALATLYSFTGGVDGSNAYAALIQAKDGNFYGTTKYGGTNNAGTIFQITPNGILTSLYSFNSGTDGANPIAPLVQGTDGSFYGTALNGGRNGVGTVFRLTTVPTPPVFQATTLANGTLNLTWSTDPGETYQLQFISDLRSTNWSELGASITATSTTLGATDSSTNGPQRFYRVVRLP
jgi:uncharacterized repeat protein (TIGR03803 family)